jgi:DNA-binding MarR family transcriptional regulator
MLDKLEAMGYAKRSRTDQRDQRQVYVTLTLPGAVALRDAEGVFLERVHAFLKVLSPAEQTTLARLLDALSERQQPSTHGSVNDVDRD